MQKEKSLKKFREYADELDELLESTENETRMLKEIPTGFEDGDFVYASEVSTNRETLNIKLTKALEILELMENALSD